MIVNLLNISEEAAIPRG